MPTETQMTAGEALRQKDVACGRMVSLMTAYSEFPTAANFDIVATAMRDYQTAWMHEVAIRNISR